MDKPSIPYFVAQEDFVPETENSERDMLTLKKGEIVFVKQKATDSEFWFGESATQEKGWFPKNIVAPASVQDISECEDRKKLLEMIGGGGSSATLRTPNSSRLSNARPSSTMSPRSSRKSKSSSAIILESNPARRNGDLSVNKGELVKLLSKREGLALIEKKDGSVGIVPFSIVSELD